MLRFSTAGESHGEALIALVQGLPAGLEVDQAFINRELWRRQQGYGRGGRMRIETDTAHILSGVRHGHTIGSPVAMQIANRDWKNWEEILPVERAIRRNIRPWPRRVRDMRTSRDRSSTTLRMPGMCWSGRRRANRRRAWPLARWRRCCCASSGIEVASHVIRVGRAELEEPVTWEADCGARRRRTRCC